MGAETAKGEGPARPVGAKVGDARRDAPAPSGRQTAGLHGLHGLQRQIGNQAVVELLRSSQANRTDDASIIRRNPPGTTSPPPTQSTWEWLSNSTTVSVGGGKGDMQAPESLESRAGSKLSGEGHLWGDPEEKKRFKDNLLESLDIAKIEIKFNPGDMEKKVGTLMGVDVNQKVSSEAIVSMSAKALKANGKLEASWGRGHSAESPALSVKPSSTTDVDAKFAVEGFAGSKVGVEGGFESSEETTSLKGKLGAFAGLEVSPKTEFVLKANNKELVRFKGGLTFTVGVGGEISGSWEWPVKDGGTLSFKSKGKGSVGLGLGWDIDVQIPVPSLMMWLWQNGWEWASWAGKGLGTGLWYGGKALYNVGYYGMKGVGMAMSGLSSMIWG